MANDQPITVPVEVVAAAREVVAYLWKDEERDFATRSESEKGRHVFQAVQTLRKHFGTAYYLGRGLKADIRCQRGAEDDDAQTRLFLECAWERALQMAHENGWGAEQDLALYVAADGLDISAQDAANMADAIEAAITEAEEEAGAPGYEPGLLDDGAALLDNCERWEDFVSYCRGGGFHVTKC